MTCRSLMPILTGMLFFVASFAQAQIFDPNANRLKELRSMVAQTSIDEGVGRLEGMLSGMVKKNIGIKHFTVTSWDMWAPENANLLNIRLVGKAHSQKNIKKKQARKQCANNLRFIKNRLSGFEGHFVKTLKNNDQVGKIEKFIRTYSNIDLALEDHRGKERARCNSYFGTSRISYRKSKS